MEAVSDARPVPGRTDRETYADAASGLVTGAEWSPCRRWRYALWRLWGPTPPLVFVGLNPSTADAFVDDPTVRRCTGYARRENAGGLVMLNAFAWRSTDPRGLRAAAFNDPVGVDNDAALRFHTHGRRVVLAWGTHGRYGLRDRRVVALLRAERRALFVLGYTAGGDPRHPLYMRADAPLVPFVEPEP